MDDPTDVVENPTETSQPVAEDQPAPLEVDYELMDQDPRSYSLLDVFKRDGDGDG